MIRETLSTYLLGISFNQPKFSSCATWNANATTLADENLIGQFPTDVFINTRNSIYVINDQNNRVLIGHNGTLARYESISESWVNPWSLFVTDIGDIFIDNGYTNGRVDKWLWNRAQRVSVMNVNSSCTGLFIDVANSLYCSSANEHRVLKLELDYHTSTPMVVAGTGCPGPIVNMLDYPHGIFVDENFNLFVADTNNNRIQLFRPGQLNAVTVAGLGAPNFFVLNRPTDIVLDGNGSLFIVDSHNHRIIRLVSNKSQCLLGCSGKSGASSSQLYNPQSMAFDPDGHILVTDFNNHRIQKFMLAQNSCGMYIHVVLGYSVVSNLKIQFNLTFTYDMYEDTIKN